MTKYLFLLLFFTTTLSLFAQRFKPQSVFASYFGETVTHPGLKIGCSYTLKTWEVTKMKKGEETVLRKSFTVNPAIGFYCHKGYQTGLFFLPEWSFLRQNAKGNFIAFGIGAGYLRTSIPNVYLLNSSGEIEKARAGNHYFVTNYSATFGKDLSISKQIPIAVFLKPQFRFAVPNYSKGILYFDLELGVSYRL